MAPEDPNTAQPLLKLIPTDMVVNQANDQNKGNTIIHTPDNLTCCLSSSHCINPRLIPVIAPRNMISECSMPVPIINAPIKRPSATPIPL